jgi:SAM-dependent methyltransferase
MGLDGDDEWSPLADDWARLWGGFAEPVRRDLLVATAIGAGTRLLDAGCGSGELLRLATELGATVAGCDPASGMLGHAARVVPEAVLRRAGLDALPWSDGSFDVVTAVNALQFADDPDAGLAEVRRVLVPGGRFGIASWAERARNEIDVLESAVAAADGDEPPPDPPNRFAGGLEATLAAAGFTIASSGSTKVPWEAPDETVLVAGVLLGENPSVLRELGPVVVAAAAPFRRPDGSFRLVNRFRWAVGVIPF